MTPDVSAIVPVYKVEKYLHRCIDSLVDQTYGNIEIILVDDGSPDGCAGMCDERALSDTRITVVHQQNGGVSRARNVGMANATGDYFAFLDSDDYSELCLIEKLRHLALDTSSEITVCGYFTEYTYADHISKLVLADAPQTYEGNDVGKAYFTLESKGGFDVLWNKLYSSALIKENSIAFEEGLCEDYIFNAACFNSAKRIATLADCLQHYMRQDEDSLVRAYNHRLIEFTRKKLEIRKALFQKFELVGESYCPCYSAGYISAMFACVPNLYRGTEVPFSEKLSVFRAMCYDAELIDSLRWFSPTGTFMKLYCGLIKLRAPSFMACIFGVLFFFRNHCRKLYKSIFSFLLKRGKQ